MRPEQIPKHGASRMLGAIAVLKEDRERLFDLELRLDEEFQYTTSPL